MLSLEDRFLKSLERRRGIPNSLNEMDRTACFPSRNFLRIRDDEKPFFFFFLFFPPQKPNKHLPSQQRKRGWKVSRKYLAAKPPERDKSMEHRFQSLFTNFSNFLPPPRILALFARKKIFRDRTIRDIYIYIYIIRSRNRFDSKPSHPSREWARQEQYTA